MLIWSHPSIKGLVKAEYQTDLSLNHLFIKVVFPGNGSRIAKKLRVRTCVPRKGSEIQAASNLILRTGSPDGPLLAQVPLPASELASPGCGYLIGSYWLPGVMK